jgi:Transposase DDE domain
MLMTHGTLLNELWAATLVRLGGTEQLAASARSTRAFLRPREVKSAPDLLRLILAHCLGGLGLRSTAVWSASVGLADLSAVALLQRLGNCGDWLQHLVGLLLASGVEPPGKGRLIRLLDATCVPKFGCDARSGNGVWRLHCAFDLPSERFSFFEMTDEKGSEQFDRVPVVASEIRIGDRGYLHPDRLAAVHAAGGDLIVRAGWKSACWLDAAGNPFALIAALEAAKTTGVLDRQVFIARKKAAAFKMRLIAFRKPPQAAETSKVKARRAAQREGSTISGETLVAAEWVILVTTLSSDDFTAAAVGDLYRLRWRIEMAFKRLKSVIGLAGPPGKDPRTAKAWILAHLLMILLLEPHTSALEVSPRQAPELRAA